ncbi:MAG: aspartate aminotransferase family protein [Methanobacteriaceae archaeon]|nr:aspartate aminotransferase family protein [Methanobacteriaceae archaeon]
MNTDEIMNLYDEYVMHTYGRQPIVLDHGHKQYVYDKDGNKYLDFFAGVAVNNVGQTDDNVVKAIKEQAEKMIHCSNIYYNEPAAILSKKLADISGLDKVFFGNSGAEANEGAIKLARKYTGKGDIVATYNSFHGRTMLTVTATGQDEYKLPFKPLPPGFKHVDFGDINAIKSAIDENTAAVLIEIVQGEGGINVAPDGYFEELDAYCKENNVLLIIDEVQTGLGRCGKMFAYQHYDIKPDIVTIAKGLGGGVPIGGTLATNEVATGFEPGDHGSTFGGNPLVCAAANAAIDTILENKLVENSEEVGTYLKSKFLELKSKYNFVVDVRGLGLLLGIELNMPGGEIVDAMREKGVLINCTAGNVLRFAPSLLITKEDVDKMILILDEVFSDIS